MKFRNVIITLLALFLCVPSFATAPTLIQPPTAVLTTVEILPMAVPTSAGDAAAVTIWVDTVYLTNTTSGALTVTIADKQGSPVTLVPTVSLPANSVIILQLWGIRMDGGFTWVASGVGVNGYFKGKVR